MSPPEPGVVGAGSRHPNRAPERLASAARPWRSAQGKTVAWGGRRPFRGLPLLSAGVTSAILSLALSALVVLVAHAVPDLPASGTEPSVTADTTHSWSFQLPYLDHAASKKITRANHLELVFDRSGSITRWRLSRDRAEWGLWGEVLNIESSAPLSSTSPLVEIRTKERPHPLAVMAIGIPAGLVLGMVAAVVIGSSSSPDSGDAPVFDVDGTQVGVVVGMTLIGGPLLAYTLTNTWRTAYRSPGPR
jgi:hypothetical protein